MTTTSDPSLPVTDPSAADARVLIEKRPSTSASLRPLLLRMHFYAGVLVAPFIVLAALTGLAYLFSPQLSDLVHRDLLIVDPVPATPALPLDAQVAAALAARPDATLSHVVVPGEPNRTTVVQLAGPGVPEDHDLSVYVDPYTAQVRGVEITAFDDPPLTLLLDQLHSNLLIGDTGRLYSELAASWLPVLVLGGLALWVGRRRRRKLAAMLLPPAGMRPGRGRIMGWHGATGVWLVVALLFIGVTGMTWSTYAGERFAAVVDALHGRTPQLVAEPRPVPTGARTVGVGAALAAGRDAGLVGVLSISAPEAPGAPYTVAERDGGWPVQRDKVAVDAYTGAVVESIRWADFPVPAKLTTIGILAHMGTLFGLPNQLALLAMGLGLVSVIFWGYRMWWQRRPTGPEGRARFTEAVPRGTLRALSQPAAFVVVLITVVVCWAAPVLGVSLVVFLVVDALRGFRARRRGPSGRVHADVT